MKAIKVLSIVLILLLIAVITAYKANAAEPIKVMVIDTGIDVTHPSLIKWKRYYTKDIDKVVDHYHGTAMASLILNGEVDKTGAGKTPVCKEVELVVCNYLPFKNSARLIECLKAAVTLKVDMVNYSSSGEDFQASEYEQIKRLQQQDTLFITAAGNEGKNLKTDPRFPAMYRYTSMLKGIGSSFAELKNIIIVGALNDTGTIWKSSGYGVDMTWRKGIDVRAAVTTDIGQSTSEVTGTSVSTALYTNELLRKKCEVKDASKNAIIRYSPRN